MVRVKTLQTKALIQKSPGNPGERRADMRVRKKPRQGTKEAKTGDCMNHVNCKINDVCGALSLAPPMAKPDYGSIMRIIDVPDDAQPGEVVRKAGRIVFWPKEAGQFAPTVISWSLIANAQPGALIRY
jgi:hypothetical protein